MLLPHRLHGDAAAGVHLLGGDEPGRQVLFLPDAVGLHIPRHHRGIDLIVDVLPVEGFGLAGIAVGEDGLDAPGNPQHGRQAARGGDGEQLAVAQGRGGACAMGAEEGGIGGKGGVALGEGALLSAQVQGGLDGLPGHCPGDALAQFQGLAAPVGNAKLRQHIRQAHDAQPDLPPIPGARPLNRQGVQEDAFVQHLVERFYPYPDRLGERIKIEGPVFHKGGQVEAAQQAAAAQGQGFLGAGVDAGVMEVRVFRQEPAPLHRVPEKDARLPHIPIVEGELVQHTPRVDPPRKDFAGLGTGKGEQDLLVRLGGLHECVGHAHGGIGLGHPAEVLLDVDKGFDIRVFAGHGDHHGAPAAVLGDEPGDQGKQVHKGHGAAGGVGRVVDLGSLRRQGADVDAAAAAVAVGASQVPGGLEDGLNGILYPQHVAVGQGGLFARPRQTPPRQNAPAEKKFLFEDELGHPGVAPADPGDPLVEALVGCAVFLFPDIQTQLIIRAQPFLCRQSQSLLFPCGPGDYKGLRGIPHERMQCAQPAGQGGKILRRKGAARNEGVHPRADGHAENRPGYKPHAPGHAVSRQWNQDEAEHKTSPGEEKILEAIHTLTPPLPAGADERT